MSKEKIYPKGLMVFGPRDGAPDFVKGVVVLSMRELMEWAKTQQEHYSDYNGKKQLRFQLLEGEKGLYLQLDTWKPEKKAEPTQPKKSDDLPF